MSEAKRKRESSNDGLCALCAAAIAQVDEELQIPHEYRRGDREARAKRRKAKAFAYKAQKLATEAHPPAALPSNMSINTGGVCKVFEVVNVKGSPFISTRETCYEVKLNFFNGILDRKVLTLSDKKPIRCYDECKHTGQILPLNIRARNYIEFGSDSCALRNPSFDLFCGFQLSEVNLSSNYVTIGKYCFFENQTVQKLIIVCKERVVIEPSAFAKSKVVDVRIEGEKIIFFNRVFRLCERLRRMHVYCGSFHGLSKFAGASALRELTIHCDEFREDYISAQAFFSECRELQYVNVLTTSRFLRMFDSMIERECDLVILRDKALSASRERVANIKRPDGSRRILVSDLRALGSILQGATTHRWSILNSPVFSKLSRCCIGMDPVRVKLIETLYLVYYRCAGASKRMLPLLPLEVIDVILLYLPDTRIDRADSIN